jgi:Spy/CpxP family protein refolding chaperone
MSYGVQSTGLFGSLSVDGSTSTSLRPFANLDLTEDQRAQVRSILKNAKSEGLSQDQIQQEINSILTPTQQTTFQSDQASVSSSASSAAASSSATQSTSTQPNPFTDANGPFANLNLTSSQQSQVSQILADAQSEGLTFSQVNSQISSILTTTQQTSFESDLASLPTAGGNSSPSGGSSSTSSNPAGSVQQQIAAAAALILQQIEQDISNQSSSSSSSGSASSTQSAPNPFSDPNGPFANLNLTQDQQTQISQILSSAQTQGLTVDQINSEINGVLTTGQQSTFSSDLANLPTAPGSSGTSASAASSSPSSGFSIASIQQQIEAAAEAILQQIEQSAQSTTSNANSSSTVASTSDSTQSSQSTFNPVTDPNGPFANLNLTSDQQSRISQILSEAQSQGLTPEQVNSQISGLLSTTQQATFSSDLAGLQLPASSGGSSEASTATANVSGQSQIGSDGTIASSSTATETQIQRQIAAAESLVLQQIQYGLENSTP